jgi:hypothetical protein
MVEFRKTAVIGDFSMDSTVALVAGKYIELMSMQVPAQQVRFWGNGSIRGGVDDRGTFKLNVNTTAPANIPGTARIVVADANKVVRNFRREDRSDDLNTSAGGVKLGKDVVGAGQDSYLTIEYNCDSSATATLADTTVFAPITIRTV